MASPEELKEVRLKKVELLRQNNIEPYPSHVDKNHDISSVISDFDKIIEKKEIVRLAGRVMSMRGQGAILFADLYDGTGRFQIVFKKDDSIGYTNHQVDGFEMFIDTADVGDFIEVGGYLFVTKSGQNSLEVRDWRMLTKSLLPIPDEFYGLKDQDERYRKRYLDILMNEKVADIFVKKARFWELTRKFFNEKGFLEVETPILELTTGGAEANPFKTHHKDFDMDVYLRISVGELWQKRLLAGGFNKIFEIGRVFRNEGSSNEHLQEFTNLEFYWAYADYRDGMKLSQELFRKLATDVFDKTKFETRGHTFDLADEWIEIDYVLEIKKQTGIEVLTDPEDSLKKKLGELGVQFEGNTRERLADSLWKYCRKNISGPAFLINHPELVSPLSKQLPDKPEQTQRFQIILAGSEVGNGFSELNDPIKQNERFDVQEKLIASGDTEAMMKDKEFIEMLEYGMPPACGFGFGERFFAFLVDEPAREIQTFPLMKPKE